MVLTRWQLRMNLHGTYATTNETGSWHPRTHLALSSKAEPRLKYKDGDFPFSLFLLLWRLSRAERPHHHGCSLNSPWGSEYEARYVMASAPEVHEQARSQFSTLPEAVPLPGQDKEVLRYQHAGSGSPLPRGWSSLSRRCHVILIAIVVILAAAIIGIVVGVVVHKNQVYVMPNPFKRSSILIPNQQRVFINTHWIYDHIFSKFGNSNQSIYPDANFSLPWNSLPFDANSCGGHDTFCACWFKPLLHAWARQSYMVSKRRWCYLVQWLEKPRSQWSQRKFPEPASGGELLQWTDKCLGCGYRW